MPPKNWRNLRKQEKVQETKGHTSDTGDGLLAGEIGNMDEGVVEGGVDVCDTEYELALSNLGTERDGLLLGDLDLLGGLHPDACQSIHPNFCQSSAE